MDYLIIDSVLIGYLIINSQENLRDIEYIGNSKIYKSFIREFINTMSYLKNKFGGEIVLLFDNYESREQINQLLRPLDEHQNRKKVNPRYKAQRRSEKSIFYDSLDKIQYYYRVASAEYHTARIINLEADDLVKPCISYLRGKSNNCKILLVTNDSDWCRYIDANTLWLPELYKEPKGINEFYSKFGFNPTEESIILNKIMFGDNADNIQCVFPEIPSEIRKFIVKTFPSIADFMLTLKQYPETSEFSFLVKEKEIEIKSAYQMLATIPVTEEHFRAVYTTGRNSEMIQKNLNSIIFKEEKENGFTFGDISIPRYSPKN